MTIFQVFTTTFMQQNDFRLFPAAADDVLSDSFPRFAPTGFDELDVNAFVAGSFSVLRLKGYVYIECGMYELPSEFPLVFMPANNIFTNLKLGGSQKQKDEEPVRMERLKQWYN